MIPILFNGSRTSFSTNGIGRLTDTISCEVTEERNGIFELVMTYPTNGIHYSDIKVTNLIVVKPNQTQERQAFEIYEISKPIDQIITVKANHISYRQSFIPVQPFIATGIANALNGLSTNALETSPFTFWTNIDNTETTYNQSIVKSMRACLGGSQGSILDTYSGSGTCEYEWNNFETKVWTHRGSDNGVQLRYRKNISDLEQTETVENTVTGVLPVWTNNDDTVSFHGDIQYSANVDDYPNHRTVILDLSSEFESTPTVQELNQARQRYIARAVIHPEKNIKVSFVDLTQTSEFENIAVLETVNLCDTIKVIYPPLGISYDAKVIRTVWDVLKGSYTEIEIGTPKSNIARTIADNLGDIKSLKLTNNKLVSVTQTIDRELGEVQTTVASVEEKADTAVSTTSQLQIDLSGIQTQVTDTQTSLENYATKDELAQTSSSLSTSISQTAENITLNINSINNTVTEQGNQLTELNSYFDFSNTGLTIGKSDSEVKLALENDELSFNDNTNKLAWLDSSDGLGASALSIGDANTQANRWRIFTRSNGSHLTFTRHN